MKHLRPSLFILSSWSLFRSVKGPCMKSRPTNWVTFNARHTTGVSMQTTKQQQLNKDKRQCQKDRWTNKHSLPVGFEPLRKDTELYFFKTLSLDISQRLKSRVSRFDSQPGRFFFNLKIYFTSTSCICFCFSFINLHFFYDGWILVF